MNDAARWVAENQRELTEGLDRVRAHLSRHAGEADAAPAEPAVPGAGPFAERYALATLRRAFGLSDFERDVVLLLAGVEMDSRFPALVAAVRGDLSWGVGRHYRDEES